MNEISISYSMPSRKLTYYPSLGQGQGKSSSKAFFEKDILVPGRVFRDGSKNPRTNGEVNQSINADSSSSLSKHEILAS